MNGGIVKTQPDFKAGGLIYSFAILLYFVLSLIGQSVIAAVTEAGTFAYYAVASLFSVVSLSIAVFVFVKRHEGGFIELTFIKKFDYKFVFISILISAGMFLGLGFINTLFANLLINLGLKVPSANVPVTNAAEFIVFSITLCLLPAFIEEIFFRGVLLQSVKKSGTFISALTVGLFFALYHVSFSQLIYQFIYGAVLAVLVIKSKSSVPAMFSHFINNFLVVAFYFFRVNVDFFNPFIIVSGLIALAAGLTLLFIKSEKEKPLKGIATAYIYGSLGIFISVALIVLRSVA